MARRVPRRRVNLGVVAMEVSKSTTPSDGLVTDLAAELEVVHTMRTDVLPLFMRQRRKLLECEFFVRFAPHADSLARILVLTMQ